MLPSDRTQAGRGGRGGERTAGEQGRSALQVLSTPLVGAEQRCAVSTSAAPMSSPPPRAAGPPSPCRHRLTSTLHRSASDQHARDACVLLMLMRVGMQVPPLPFLLLSSASHADLSCCSPTATMLHGKALSPPRSCSRCVRAAVCPCWTMCGAMLASSRLFEQQAQPALLRRRGQAGRGRLLRMLTVARALANRREAPRNVSGKTAQVSDACSINMACSRL